MPRPVISQQVALDDLGGDAGRTPRQELDAGAARRGPPAQGLLLLSLCVAVVVVVVVEEVLLLVVLEEATMRKLSGPPAQGV